MNIKHFSLVAYLFLIFAVLSCSDNVVPDFSYLPKMPKRGEKVTFTNLTTADEDWEVESWSWTFGDESTSLLKSPTHTYKEAGKYKVTLMVDSSKYKVKTMDIVVYDTIPTMITDVDSVEYYQEVTFSALAYNPYYADVTYEWTFSENAQGDELTEGVSTEEEVTVYFTKKNVEEYVYLHLVIEDEIDTTIVDTFYVHDIKAKSLLMAQKSGEIIRQRIIDNGVEDPELTGIAAGKHPFNMFAVDNTLVIFDAGTKVEYAADWLTNTSGDGSIRLVNLVDKTSNEIIHNRGTSSHFGFFNGFVDKNYIYWADYSEFLYKTPINSNLGAFTWKGNQEDQTTVPYYLVKTDRLGYFGKGMSANQPSGGVAYFDQAYFWAKGGAGRGIYRFLPSEILSTTANSSTAVPTMGAILKDFAIRSFSIDELNMKIYFSVTAPADKVGLWVSNIDGTNPKIIDNSPMDDPTLYITGILVDNESNRVYWAYRSPETVGASPATGTWAKYYEDNPMHRSGIKMATLATYYKPTGTVEYFAPGIVAYGIALDEVKKY